MDHLSPEAYQEIANNNNYLTGIAEAKQSIKIARLFPESDNYWIDKENYETRLKYAKRAREWNRFALHIKRVMRERGEDV